MAVFIARRWGDDMWKIIRGLSLIYILRRAMSFCGQKISVGQILRVGRNRDVRPAVSSLPHCRRLRFGRRLAIGPFSWGRSQHLAIESPDPSPEHYSKERMMYWICKPELPFFKRMVPILAVLLWLAGTRCFAQTPLTGIAKIATGTSHNCALTINGGLKCWGLNNEGQIGDNSFAQRLTAVDVFGLSSGVSAITSGYQTSCALTIAGAVKCWGYNGSGELGNASNMRSTIPVQVFGLTSGMTAVALGFRHTCAIGGGGGVKCWGDNAAKELGNRNNTISNVPVDVLTSVASPLLGASALATGGFHSCVMGGGNMTCWGSNGYGQMGNGVLGPSAEDAMTVIAGPALPPLANIAAIAAGSYHTCALNNSGGVQCWGRNDFGQLGTSSPITESATPIDVSGLTSGVSAISTGDRHSCALIGGAVKCWGYNFYGQLGNNTNVQSPTPVDVFGLTTATAIAAGGVHTCALIANGGVKCWGSNFNGELGDNSQNPSQVPVDVLTIAPVTFIGAQSRKLHDVAGTFDLPLNRFSPITGPVTVEPRVPGALHAIVFQFDGPITIPGTVTAVDGGGMTIPTGSPTSVPGNGIAVNLIGILDNSRATIALTGVNGNVNASTSIGFLVGDVNNTRNIDSIDVSAVKARSGQITDSTNFNFDVNTTGVISVSDILTVKARTGSVLVP